MARVSPLAVVAAGALALPFAPPALLGMSLEGVGSVVLALVGISLLIVIHEAGHFVTALWCGVRVEVFSIGFGPRLCGFQRGTVDYRISAIPVGGYVAMAGESPEDDLTGAEWEFASKTVGQRALILSAGVVMNVVLAVVLFIIAFSVGVRFVVPVVGAVQPGGASHGVLQRGDRIVAIDGREITDYGEIQVAAALADPDTGLELEFQRPGEAQTRTATVNPRRGPSDNFPRLNVEPMKVLAAVDPESAAAEALLWSESVSSPARALVGGTPGLARSLAERGLRAGDRILASLSSDSQGQSLLPLWRRLRDSPGRPVSFAVERPLEGGGHRRLHAVIVPRRRAMRTVGIKLSSQPRVRSVMADSPADRQGLEEDDLLVSIGAEPVTYSNLRDLVEKTGGKPTEFVVERPGDADARERVVLQVAPEEVPGGYRLGIGFDASIVEAVAPGSEAEKAGVLPGDRLDSVSVGDYLAVFPKWRSVTNEQGLSDLLTVVGDRPTELLLKRDGVQITITVGPSSDSADKAWGEHGIALSDEQFTLQVGMGRACVLGFHKTVVMTERILMMLRGLLSRRVSPKELGGPVQIVHVSYRLAQQGMGTLLFFLALLSVNLAVINVLPIPALDGGHLMFVLIEKLRGSPAPREGMFYAQLLGIALLLLLMLFVFANDIMRFRG